MSECVKFLSFICFKSVLNLIKIYYSKHADKCDIKIFNCKYSYCKLFIILVKLLKFVIAHLDIRLLRSQSYKIIRT